MKNKMLKAILVASCILFSLNLKAQWETYTAEVETGLIKGGNKNTAFCEDKAGNIWIGNTKGSLIKYNSGKWEILDVEKVSIAAQTNLGEVANAKTGSYVYWTFKKDKINNWCWFACNKNTFLWTGEILLEMTGNLTSENHMIFYSKDEEKNYIIKESKLIEHTEDKLIKPNKPVIQISALTVDSKNRVWLGNWRGEIFCLNKGKWKVIEDIRDMEIKKMIKIRSKGISAIHENADGSFWITGNSFIAKYDGTKTELVKSVKIVTDVITDNNNDSWFCYFNGISKYSDGKWYDIKPGKEFKKIAVGGKFMLDQNNTLWFMAHPNPMNLKDGGVYKYDGEKWEKQVIDKKNKMTDLFEDSEGNIWCTTYPAVYKYENDEWKLKKKSESVLSASYIKIFEDSKGAIWFGMGSFKGRIERFVPE